MKRNLLFIFILCSLTTLFAQKKRLPPIPVKTEYIKADSNTYMVEYYDEDDEYDKYISNKINPYEGVSTKPWQDNNMKISFMEKYPEDIAKEVLRLYYHFDKKDEEILYLRVFYDLNGDVQHVVVGLPTEIDVPIKVIEELENRLKKESKLKVEYDPNKVKGVNYIMHSNLLYIRKE